MLISINDIPARGLRLDEDATPAHLLLAPEDGVKGPVRLELFLDRNGTQVRVTGRAVARLETQCHRCAEPCELPLDAEIETCFQPATDEDPVVLPEDEEAFGLSHYEGDLLDLGPLLRDGLLLAVPMVHLCRPDCAGLCPDCGNRRPANGHCECPASRERALSANPFAEFFRRQKSG